LRLAGNSGYLDFSEILAMPLMLLVMLAPAQLENAHFIVAPLRQDFRLHRGSGNQRPAHLEIVTVGDQEHLVKYDFSPDVCRYLFYFQFFAGSDAVLLAAGFYDRVHVGDSVKTNCDETKEPEMIQQFSFGGQKLYAILSSPAKPVLRRRIPRF
jgi:hypothetical protein